MLNMEIYDKNGEVNEAYRDHAGLEIICQLIESKEDKHDLWLIYEFCKGKPLTKLLWTRYGDFF